jgi:hypothetical protein
MNPVGAAPPVGGAARLRGKGQSNKATQRRVLATRKPAYMIWLVGT